MRRWFLKFVYILSLFHYYLPVGKDMVLRLNKHDFPSPQDALCQVWLKLAKWFIRRRFFKLRQCIFAISLSYPLRKGRCPLFEQIWIPITQGYFVPSFVELGPVVLKKILKVHQCIFAISLLSPLGKGHGPSFEQTWILLT